MKEIKVLYGKGAKTFKIPDENLAQIVTPQVIPGNGDQTKIIDEAIKHPINGPSLKELTKDVKNILIISPDNTRPMPSRISIPAIIKNFYHEDSHYHITILIATGLHRKMTDEEILERYGEETVKKYDIINHVAKDDSEQVSMGKMSTGNELFVDKRVLDNDLIIGEGFIEPHFFAGFSGGRKCVLPGIASKDTILNNHCPQNIANAHATAGSLDGNPIHEEATEAAKKVGLAFILNVALNQEKAVVAAFAGDFVEAHKKGCEFVREHMKVPVKPADIVITSNDGFPLDRNLYQSVKGMDTSSRAVKKGGVIILCSECSDKANGNNAFEELIAAAPTKEELYSTMSTGKPEVDKWEVQIFARVVKDHTVIFVSDNYDEQSAKDLFMIHATSPEDAMEKAFAIAGKNAKVNVMPEGPVTLPIRED
mgnify:CR=1 FL=1